MIKRIFRDICEAGIKKPGKTKLPILIELKNISPPNSKVKDLGKWFYEYIKDELSRNRVYKMGDCLDNYAATKGTIILLDGLDEVSTSNYNRISTAINKLSDYLTELSANNLVVLTMRTQFYQQIKEDFSITFPHSTFLKPFTPSDIYEFLSRWHFKKESERNISRIYKDLTDRPTLREMCSNSLILSMYVAEDQMSGGSVSPESRTQFYKKVTEELIIKRRLKQKSSISVSYSTLKEQRERILGKITYNNLINVKEPRNTLKWGNLILIVRDILKCDEEKAETTIYEISKETGLISEEKHKESFRFIHLTFCEYLAAFEVAQGVKNGWKRLISYHKDFTGNSNEGRSRLIEVIPFTAGLLPRIDREQAISDIADLNDVTLMSRCFLETKLYEHKSWSKFINESRSSLLRTHGNQFDENWIQELHLFNVVVKDAQLVSENLSVDHHIDLNEFYEKLLENEKNSLSKILSAFASQDAAAAFRLCEICSINLQNDFPQIVIENCDQIPFLGLVKDKIVQDQGNAEKWAELAAISHVAKGGFSYLINRKKKLSTVSFCS